MRTTANQAKTAPAMTAHKSNQSQPLVLIVDDLEHVRLSMKLLFEQKAGARVLSANTSEEALQLARKNPKLDLVISDIRRPGMDGMAFLEVFKKERPGVPVMMVSGALSSAARQRAYRLGASACYRKPVTLRRLLGAVTKTLQRAHHD